MSMNDPLWTRETATARAQELVRQYLRTPDVLSPDEQALAMRITILEERLYRIVDETMPYTLLQDMKAGMTIMVRIPKPFMVRD